VKNEEGEGTKEGVEEEVELKKVYLRRPEIGQQQGKTFPINYSQWRL